MTTELLQCPFCGTTPFRTVAWGEEAAEHTHNDCVLRNRVMPVDKWNTRALPSSPDEKSAQAATAVNTAEGVGIRLFDGQWVNIVNAENCYREYSKEEAVHKAVKATEEKMRENIVKGWPKPRTPSPPASASMSAGVTEAQVDAALLAIFPGKHDEYLRVNWRPTVRAMLEQYERARANTREPTMRECADPNCPKCHGDGSKMIDAVDDEGNRCGEYVPCDCLDIARANTRAGVACGYCGRSTAEPTHDLNCPAGDAKGAEQPYSDTEAFGGGRLG